MNNPYQQQQQQQQPPPLQVEWSQPSFNSNGFSEPFQQQSNPYQQQPAAQNPYLQSNQFNASGLQAQMTGFVSSPQVQQQPTMDFFSQQQSQQGLQAQMTGFPQQQPSFQTSMVTGTNPFSQMSGSQQQQQPIQPQQHDYSELVFGNATNSPAQQKQQSPFPLPAAQTANTPNFFNTPSSPSAFANTNAFNPSSPRIAASPKAPTEQDTKYAKLNSLLANKE